MKKTTMKQETQANFSKHYFCKFCGQCGKLDRIKDFATEEEATETATHYCDCTEAVFYRQRKENIKRLNEAVGEFTDYCEYHKIKLNEDVAPLITSIGTHLIDRKIGKCTLAFANIQIAMAIGSKSCISLTFKFSDGRKIEI